MDKIVSNDFGHKMWELTERLWPICRSLTGDGVRETFNIIQEHIPIKIHEVPTGTKVFDWEVPKEWKIRDAYVLNEKGEKIIDFKVTNLHVVGYSAPVDKWVDLAELQNHLHSIEEQPDVIPLITSYYKEYWGFCISHTQRKSLPEGKYYVHIDSELFDGSLTYAELIIPGASPKEVFLSSYICHPSVANDNLSGPVVLTFLAKLISANPKKYTYRIIFIPETIGAIAYLAKHHLEMKKNTIAGFNLSCVGDNNNFSFVSSRYADTYADKIIERVLTKQKVGFKKFSYLMRGSDERQFCSPGIDLPLITFSRTKFGEFPEYHTSLDNLDYICKEGLLGSLEVLMACIDELEQNNLYQVNVLCEPQLGKRGLYPTINTKKSVDSVKRMMHFIAYADGKNDLVSISEITGIPEEELLQYADILVKNNLIEIY
jgi:aminopeptidase-like protein